MSTKVQAVVDALGNCVRLVLTPGQPADCCPLLAALPQAPGAVMADRAYDTNAGLTAVAACGAVAVIAAKHTRQAPRPCEANRDAERNKAERFFGRLKEARGLATRYEKTATSFLALAQVLAALDWMR